MSESKETEADEKGPEATEEGASGSPSDEQPAISDDERADLPDDLAAVAEEVEEEAGAATDSEDDDTDDSEDADSDAPEPASPGTAEGTTDWGDLYCDTVVTGLNAVVEEHGHESADPIDDSLPRDLDLDHYVNEWMAQQGKAEMEPGEGIVVGTLVLTMTVLTTKTDLPKQALGRAKSASGGDD
jgi:hypothetical protein